MSNTGRLWLKMGLGAIIALLSYANSVKISLLEMHLPPGDLWASSGRAEHLCP